MSQINNITLENYRVFKEEFSMDLAPLTIMTGPNSSGKSSIIKALLLLKSNSNSNLQVLDFSGKNHNLGTYNTTLNSLSDPNDLIFFSISLDVNSDGWRSSFMEEPRTTRRSVYNILHENDSVNVTSVKIKLGYRKLENSGRLSEIKIFSKNSEIPFLILTIADSEDDKHTLLFDYTQISRNKVLKAIFFEDILRRDYKVKKTDKKFYTIDANFKLHEDAKSKFYDEPIFVFGKLYRKFIEENVDKVNPKEKEFPDFLLSLPLRRMLNDFSLLIDNMDYLEAVRANTKRLYTNDSQGTSFNDLILEFNSRDLPEISEQFLNKWLEKFEIAEKISFKNIEGVATSISLQNGNVKTALADLGYGITQFLPILLKISLEQPIISNVSNKIVKKIILLEEPETNLHPKLQSLLADFLKDALDTFEVLFLIETHSEYLIRKLQILRAEKKIIKNECLIYYFINPTKVNADNQQIKKIEIEDNGALSDDFGEGFFDEATRMKFELLRLKSKNLLKE